MYTMEFSRVEKSMIIHDLKRQRRLHRKLNDSTHFSDFKKAKMATEESAILDRLFSNKEVSLTWYQKLIQWLQKLTKKFSKS